MGRLLREVQEDVLSRLGRVSVAARHAVESVLSGQHRSVHRGLSVEFAGHRPYQPGDDLRHLDWRVYARTDRYDVQLYEEETRLRATIVVDTSGSMGYGPERSKFHYARTMAAALAFLMVRQGDAVGLACCDTEVRQHLPPGSTMGHLLTIFDRLEQVEVGGETSLGTVLDNLAERLSRRGLIILITDAFDDTERFTTALKHLRHRRQDVRLFQVVDPAEEQFPFKGTYEFVGLEAEKELKLDADRLRHRYQAALASHRQAISAGCHAASIINQICRTDQDLALTLVHALTETLAPTGGARR